MYKNYFFMLQIIILAAGKGKRMKSDIPKPLVEINGQPILRHLLNSIKKSGVCEKPVIVVGKNRDLFRQVLGDEVNYVLQKEPLGTGHAVAVCKNKLPKTEDGISVLYADHPLIAPATFLKLFDEHQKNKNIITLMTTTVKDFNDWRLSFYDFGRILRVDGKIFAIVEKKDATPEQLKIKEVNPGYYCFNSEWLWQNIDKLKNENAQKEYLITDLVKIAIDQGKKVTSIAIENKEAVGVNTPEQLELVKRLL
ncbi:hypothetical protein C4569_03830 [Candidatus Parcubacteria bacterium]|nr:MAG: hypothetical protein C4569_03830 [Candidatus Parcubacteria bacterium]